MLKKGDFGMKININYFIIPAITIATSFIGSYFTMCGMSWYKTISLPRFTPSGFFISFMWRFIYILSTISVLIVWNTFEHDFKFWVIIGLFVANAFLNAYWPYLFFYKHMIGAAIIEAALLGITVYALITLIWPVSWLAAILLFPYGIWVAFATFLNTVIWIMNK